MSKIWSVFVVVIAVCACYLGLLVTMPILTDSASTANVTISASSNISNYPGTTEGILAAPWALFFVPAAIGGVVIIVILRQP